MIENKLKFFFKHQIWHLGGIVALFYIGSQFVDTTLVICVLFVGVWETGDIVQAIIDGWTFKMLCALIDTPIFYICTHFLKRKFNLKINEEVSL